MIKKGYVFVTAFALFIAFSQTFKYWFYDKRKLYQLSQNAIVLKLVIIFLVFFIPLLFLVRWYYKNKIND